MSNCRKTPEELCAAISNGDFVTFKDLVECLNQTKGLQESDREEIRGLWWANCFTDSSTTQPIQGIEQGIVPLGCVKDADGNVTGKVFVCKTTQEDESATAYSLTLVNTDNSIVEDYTGTWEDCGVEDFEVVCSECLCFPDTGVFTEGADDDLAAGQAWESGLANATPNPVDSFSGIADGSYTSPISTPVASYQHRDGVTPPTNPLAGTPRTLKVETPVSQNGASIPVTGLETVGGGTTSANSIITSLNAPAGFWGADLVDVESNPSFVEATVRVYDVSWTLIDELTFSTDGMDIVKFVGVVRPTNDISHIAVTVGDANGGSLSDQLALANVRSGTIAESSGCGAKKTIYRDSRGNISTEYVDLRTGTVLTDQSEIDSLSPCETEMPEPQDYSYIRFPFCDSGTQYFRVDQYLNGDHQGVHGWTDASGDYVNIAPTNPVPGFCSAPPSDFEEQEVCADGKTVILRTYIIDGSESSEFRDETGVIPPPVTWEYGACAESLLPAITLLLSESRLDWRAACLDIGGEAVRGYTQFNKVDGLDTGISKREDTGEVGSWTTQDSCACCNGCEVTACIQFAGFDKDSGFVTPGNQNQLRIFNGGVQTHLIPHDYTTTQSGTSKASWYAPWITAVNSLPEWSMTLIQDVTLPNDNVRPLWRIEYSGTGAGSLKFEKGSLGTSTPDEMTINVDASGVVTTTANDFGNAVQWDSYPFTACP